MKQIKLDNLKNKTIVAVNAKSCNCTFLKTACGKFYSLEAENQVLGIYGPVLFKLNAKEYAEQLGRPSLTKR